MTMSVLDWERSVRSNIGKIGTGVNIKSGSIKKGLTLDDYLPQEIDSKHSDFDLGISRKQFRNIIDEYFAQE